MSDNDLNAIWQCQGFSKLSLEDLYAILALRNQVFVVEQNCPYLDIDGEDKHWYHLQGFIKQKLVAYCRIKLGDTESEHHIGRLVVEENARRLGLAHELLDKAIGFIESQSHNKTNQNMPISISAQSYLTHFYASHQFTIEGDEYLEDNIPHLRMIRLLPKINRN